LERDFSTSRPEAAVLEMTKGGAVGALGKFLGLERRKRRVLVGSALGVTRARLETRVIPFRRIAQSLALGDENERVGRETSFDQLEAVRWSTAVLSVRLPWCRNCLAQAVAAKRYLNRKGIPSTLFLGVTTEAPQTGGNLEAIEAHAWIECDGRVLTGESDTEFQIIYSQS
jgi:hypothetical protein